MDYRENTAAYSLTIISWEARQRATVGAVEFICLRRNKPQVLTWKRAFHQSPGLTRTATCDDDRGPQRGLLPHLDSVLVHLVFDLLQLVHGVQAVSPPLLLHRFAQLRLIGQLLGRLHDLPLQRESALQVSQEGILSRWTAGVSTARVYDCFTITQ